MATYSAWTGRRGRAIRDILTPNGFVARDTYGTLRDVLPLPGRFLVIVNWDNGMTVPVPASEILIFPPEKLSSEAKSGGQISSITPEIV